jgi:Uma2 family endonuclease
MARVKTMGSATIDDLRRVPKDGRVYELVDGVIVVTPAGMRHSAVAARITMLLGNFVLSHRLGQVYTEGVGIEFPSGNVRSPDVTFVSTAKLPGGRSPVDYGRLVPDLIVEVLSPGDTAANLAAKLAEYRGACVSLVWVVDPERHTVRVHHATDEVKEYGGDDLLAADPVLPGFACRVSEFFPE